MCHDNLHAASGPEPEIPQALTDVPGFMGGVRWVRHRAGPLEIHRMLRFGQQPPDLRPCGTFEEAIWQLERILMPTRAGTLESARQYWQRLRGRSMISDSLSYVAGFVEGAVYAVQNRLRNQVQSCVQRWSRRLSPTQLERLIHFVARYGDSWEHNFPQGCRNAFELFYFMMHGTLPLARQSEVTRLVQAWYVDQFPPDLVDCLFHEFAEMFVRELVLRIRQSGVLSAAPQDRELRGVRIRET